MAVLPEGALMQRAAAGLAYALISFLGGAYGKRVVLLVGSGDNGGDALYAGALLARRGASVEAWLLSEHAHPGGVAALRAAGGRCGGLDTGSLVPRALGSTNEAASVDTNPVADVVVDGIVGIGGRPGLREDAVAALDALAGVPVVAVDVPSGVDVDTGETPGPHVRADLTVTFGTHKIAHLADPAAAACGVVELVDIGLSLPGAPVEALQAADVAALLPEPARDAHKYARGVVGIRAGSATYPGAALLAVAGANTGIAGMVRYVGSAADTVTQHHPEVVGDGRVQAWVVGPGGGEGAGAELEAALAAGVPLVVDADALAHLPRPVPVDAVLTPHAGELAGMLGADRSAVEQAPLAYARDAAGRLGATVLLKGRHTVIARADGTARINSTGTPWLATAGAGDVLAGLVGSLLAAGLDAYDAASVGAWLHGSAAMLAAADGPLTASRVAAAIPVVVAGLRRP